MDSERGLWMKHEMAASVHHSNRIIRSFPGNENTLYTDAVDVVVFRVDAGKKGCTLRVLGRIGADGAAHRDAETSEPAVLMARADRRGMGVAPTDGMPGSARVWRGLSSPASSQFGEGGPLRMWSDPSMSQPETCGSLRMLRGLPDAARELGNLIVRRLLLSHLLVDLAIGMHDGGVVSSTEDLADLGQRKFRHLAAQIHGNLACNNKASRAIC